MKLFPNVTPAYLDQLMIRAGCTPPRSKKTDAYVRLWWGLRHMPMTIEGQRSAGTPPRNAAHGPARRPIGRPMKSTTRMLGKFRIAPSGASRPDSHFGTQKFYVLYTPGKI